MGHSSIKLGFSSKPCLIRRGYALANFRLPVILRVPLPGILNLVCKQGLLWWVPILLSDFCCTTGVSWQLISFFKLCYTLVIKTLPLIAPGGSPLLNQSRNCPSSKFGIQYFTVTSSWKKNCHTHVWSPIFIVQPSWFVVKSVCILTFAAWISISSGQHLFFLLVIPNFSLAHLMHYLILVIPLYIYHHSKSSKSHVPIMVSPLKSR